MVEIESYSLDEILNNKSNFNVNNLFETMPSDYFDKAILTNTKKWIDLFHDKYHIIKLSSIDLNWMKKAQKVSIITNQFSKIFDDDLESTCNKYQFQMDAINKFGNKWFIRTENYSLKYGMHGVGPYNNLSKIFQSLITYKQGHSNISENDTEKTIYFIPWIDIDRDKEFRIFVNDNKITAISQQHLYEINKWLTNKSEDDIHEIIFNINEYFNANIKNKMSYLNSYVMDLALVNDIPYFIEPNAFGAEYGSGSSLFHWKNDNEKLLGNGKIYFRYVGY